MWLRCYIFFVVALPKGNCVGNVLSLCCSYQTIGAFANDMRLVFNNAMKYNVNGSAVYNFAETLLKQFNTKFASTQWERSSGGMMYMGINLVTYHP